jgi:hypothetical protein
MHRRVKALPGWAFALLLAVLVAIEAAAVIGIVAQTTPAQRQAASHAVTESCYGAFATYGC